MTATGFDSFAAQIYLRYHNEMVRMAYHFIRNAEDAQDIVGDCWISILQNIVALQGMSENRIRACLLRCVRNKVVDFVRKNNRHQVNLYGIHESDIARYQEIKLRSSYFADSERNLRDDLAQMVSILPPRERTSISMKIKGFSTNAIAGMMGISPVTVRGYCYRAIKKLRKRAKI